MDACGLAWLRLEFVGEQSSEVGSATRQFFMILSFVDGVERQDLGCFTCSLAARRRIPRLEGDPPFSSEGVQAAKGSWAWISLPRRMNEERVLKDCQQQLNQNGKTSLLNFSDGI
jgi:hypothetical protein